MSGSNKKGPVNLKVVGVGGAGANAVAHMMKRDKGKLDFIVMDTGGDALAQSTCPHKVPLGADTAANTKPIKEALSGAGMVALVAGMGGNTGTAMISVIAQLAVDMDIPVLCLVTTPFVFEGAARMRLAVRGIEQLRQIADGVVVLPNDSLADGAGGTRSMDETLADINEAMYRGICTIDKKLRETAGVADAQVLRHILESRMGEYGADVLHKGARGGCEDGMHVYKVVSSEGTSTLDSVDNNSYEYWTETTTTTYVCTKCGYETSETETRPTTK